MLNLKDDAFYDPFERERYFIRYNMCLFCRGKMPTNYKPRYCCSGHECGCYGMPIDPFTCSDECETLSLDEMLSFKEMWE